MSRIKLHQKIYEYGKDLDAEEFVMVMIICSAEKIVSEFHDPEEQKVIVKAFYEDLKRVTSQMHIAIEEAKKYSKKVN